MRKKLFEGNAFHLRLQTSRMQLQTAQMFLWTTPIQLQTVHMWLETSPIWLQTARMPRRTAYEGTGQCTDPI